MSVDAGNVVQLIVGAVTVIGVIGTGFWALARLVVAQFEKRMKMWDARLTRIEEEHRELERNFLVHLSELPEKYQRREDHIRFETVITAKLDALYAKIEQLADRQ